ncbi:hypothetical protein PUN28_003193 [Cardiocondyla obscurior]|uniref:Uncharacterized protein n=1 Tax=Cardiocondyla obscurior TaxID=286306 RepID=A0AAW2GL29_9HYME
MRKNTSRLVSEGVGRGAMRRDDSAAISRGAFGGLRRFAFNRNPRAANTPACVPRRYEFIVYIERASSSYTQTNCTGGKLQRLYSSNGSCIAACAPLQYKARFIAHAYTYINVLAT